MRDDYDRDIDKHTNEDPCWSCVRWTLAGVTVAIIAAALWFKFG